MKPIDNQSNAVTPGIAERVRNLELPGRAGIEYASARDADRHILRCAPPAYLDATKFDTVRFPPPDWAQEALAEAAADGSLAYTGYRGDRNVLDNMFFPNGETLPNERAGHQQAPDTLVSAPACAAPFPARPGAAEWAPGG